MTDRSSLADRAIDALAAVSRMDAEVTNEHDERHHVRTLKRLAEEALSEAFRHARQLAYLAEDVRRTAREQKEGGGA
jgi:hypothetical protein